MRPQEISRNIGYISGYVIAGLATLAIGPLILTILAHIRLNWSGLSDIGQSYSGVSAALSAVAFLAVAAGIRYQSRHLKTATHVSTLEAQQQLLDRALDDADLMEVISLQPASSEAKESRQHIYCTMWLRHYHTAFMIGDFSAGFLHQCLRREHFASSVARRHWVSIRRYWETSWDSSKSHRKFVAIVDDSYVKACRDAANR